MFHNSKQLDDGTWTWRYDSFRKRRVRLRARLWDDVPAITMPTTLVRGANSFFVNDEDAAEFARRHPVSGAPRRRRFGALGAGRPAARLVEILRNVLDAQG